MNGRYYYSSLNATPKTTTSTLTLTDSNSTRKSQNSTRKSAAPYPPTTPPHRRPLPSLNRDLSTRNVCVIFVVLAWATGLAALGGGLWVLSSHAWTESAPTIIQLPEIVKQLAPLALNLWLTLLLDGVGYVHATTLKWALAREGRLGFNSNLRLFTAARSSVPNAWYANLLLFVAMVVAYSSSSLILVNWHDGENKTLDVDRLRRLWSVENVSVSVSSTSTVCLGAALLAQAFVATCALVFTHNPTWSSSPFDAVIACQRETAAERSVRYHPNRCLLSVTDKTHGSEPVRPRARQSSSWAAAREVRVVVLMLWGLAALTLVGAVPVSLVARKDGAPGVSVGGELGVEAGGMLLKTLVFSLLQAGVTLALHCAELLVNLVRDERAWRRAASKNGYRLESYNAVWKAVSSWQAFVLFLAKPAIHWVFGLAVTVEDRWVYIKGTPFFYLAGAVAALAAYITGLSLWRPKGPQPAAYGHIQTLANLIDEWSPVLYWGHKVSGPTCHAGTSSRPMADIEMDKLYAGEV
ncbi:hypothetical protein BFW01_g4856 [Lasiodiplodia theobromae]|uniref:E3 ubiquitin-protein ligase upl4 n=1 Tax=Lasiodiplodia theobromae TaxID=45133 RepID=UPI0015C38108|nr:E3 ubiquitin-protein ligase upl4 [Lasiodiplodia theobromae]KAF4542841.1 E3 ubiquitin-protein ligase upl4 [Lasiodiplodia theobromae]KAF9633961.1 hypothetical protein BFW01_g4856 [Lasiodiplodia theobromae]